MKELNNLEITNEILELLCSSSNFTSESLCRSDLNPLHHYKISTAVANKEVITFVLPAFPAKSGNRNKTLSNLPDYAEYMALKNLDDLMRSIGKIYEPGARMIICSDGRVFSDLVGISEEDVSLYKDELKSIIQTFHLNTLGFYDLEDEYGDKISFDKMRNKLESQYAKPLCFLKEEVKSKPSTTFLFNGIHRFIKEDYMYVYSDLSKNQITKLSKESAYKVVQRSDAWGALVGRRFPHAFRLSIHPQSIESEKFPINLIKENSGWGTPWHRVAVKSGERIKLMKHKEVLELGIPLKKENNLFYFEQGA